MSDKTNAAAANASEEQTTTVTVKHSKRNWKKTAMWAAAGACAVAGIAATIFTIVKKPEAVAAVADVVQ